MPSVPLKTDPLLVQVRRILDREGIAPVKPNLDYESAFRNADLEFTDGSIMLVLSLSPLVGNRDNMDNKISHAQAATLVHYGDLLMAWAALSRAQRLQLSVPPGMTTIPSAMFHNQRLREFFKQRFSVPTARCVSTGASELPVLYLPGVTTEDTPGTDGDVFLGTSIGSFFYAWAAVVEFQTIPEHIWIAAFNAV